MGTQEARFANVEACFGSPSGKRVIALSKVGRTCNIYSAKTPNLLFERVAQMDVGKRFVWSRSEGMITTIIDGLKRGSEVITVDLDAQRIVKQRFRVRLIGVDWNDDLHLTSLFRPDAIWSYRGWQISLIDFATGKHIVNTLEALPRKYFIEGNGNAIRWCGRQMIPYFATIASPHAGKYELIIGETWSLPLPVRDEAFTPRFEVSPSRTMLAYLGKYNSDREQMEKGNRSVVALTYFDMESLSVKRLSVDAHVAEFTWWSNDSILYATKIDDYQWGVRIAHINPGSVSTVFTINTAITSLCGCAESQAIIYVTCGRLFMYDLASSVSRECALPEQQS